MGRRRDRGRPGRQGPVGLPAPTHRAARHRPGAQRAAPAGARHAGRPGPAAAGRSRPRRSRWPGDGKADGKKGNGPKILIGALVVLALLAGAFFFLGGDDDGGEEGSDTTFQRDEDDDDPDDDDDETTTTEEGDTTTTEAGGTTVDVGFVTLVDETGRLTVDVPADWTDVSLAPDEGLPRILAATDANAFETGFSEPGLDLRLLSAIVPPRAVRRVARHRGHHHRPAQLLHPAGQAGLHRRRLHRPHGDLRRVRRGRDVDGAAVRQPGRRADHLPGPPAHGRGRPRHRR